MAPVHMGARRIAKDLRALHTQPLPPYYLWPSSSDGGNNGTAGSSASSSSSLPSSLTSLDILLAGPPGTPFAGGVWRVRVEFPATYPAAAPRAFFRTPIFHPNVEPGSGAVCVETLKRDWRADLTLADVLATLACLLIQPNPDSALNEQAGRLMHDGFDAFAARASLMASIHARVPAHLRRDVDEALARGEEKRRGSRRTSDGDEEEAAAEEEGEEENRGNDENAENRENAENSGSVGAGSFYVDENCCEDKENDASLSPSPVLQSPPLPIRTGVKRPLGDLPLPTPEDKENENENERNIAANAAKHAAPTALTGPSSSAKSAAEPFRRQGLMEVNRQLRAGMPPPAKKQATIRARMGIRRL